MTPIQDAVDAVDAVDAAPESVPRSTFRPTILRPFIGVVAALALACLVGGVTLFSIVSDSSAQTSTGSDLRTPVVALGLIFVAVVAERLAVALAFAHSSRKRGQLLSLLFVLFCLLMMLDSLFFTLRVRGDLHVSWTISGLPIEEALPPLEVALFAPLALAYAAWPVVRRVWRAVANLARATGATVAPRVTLLGHRRGARAQA